MSMFPHFCNHGVQPFDPVKYHMVMYGAFAADLCDTDPFHLRSGFLKSSSQASPEVFHVFLCLLSVLRAFLRTVGKCDPIIFFRHKVPLNQSPVFLYPVTLVILSHLLRRRLFSLFSLFSRSAISGGVSHLNLPAIVKFPRYPLVHAPPCP